MILILIFWILIVYTLVSSQAVLMNFFFASMAFGTFAVLPPGLTAGLTFTATPILALIIILRNLVGRDNLGFFFSSAFSPVRLGLLFSFLSVAVIVTVFMPRLFAGEVDVISLSGSAYTTNLLQPTKQNISQLFYLIISILTIFAFAKMLQESKMQQKAFFSICVGGIFVVITGLLDFVSQNLPISSILEPFRTATYALLTNSQVLGTKRVVGLMAEASSFGSLSLNFLVAIYFLRKGLDRSFLQDIFVFILMISLLLLVWLSTSSAAYVGLVVFIGVVCTNWLWKAVFLKKGGERRRGLLSEFSVALLSFLFLVFIALLKPELFDPIIQLFDTMVIQKVDTRSFDERSMWTLVSWQAVLDTYGLGVGVGGTRASSSAINVISCTGFLGAFLYFGFVVLSFIRKAEFSGRQEVAMIGGLKLSIIPSFVVSLLIGSTVDFGLFMAFLYGFISALSFGSNENNSY